ncbi:aminotransferase class IV family protein [Hydrogenimonas sp.]
MLLETISILDGTIQHLSHHQARLSASQRALFTEYTPIDLEDAIRPTSASGQIKCRVRYAQDLIDVTFEPYIPREIRRLKPIDSTIEYAYKYSDREAIEELFSRRGEADDILIVKNGLVTDTSAANIAFYDGSRWHTPKNPLLRGTTRERLLRSGFLTPRDIPIGQIDRFEAFALMNAMIGFLPIRNGIIA